MKSRSGFSIIEVTVVIVIIAILATIGTLFYLSTQQNARDSQRQAKATIIAESLEKFYDKNGEYPSPASLTGNIPANTGQLIASKIKVDQGTLVMPKASDGITNSIAPVLNDADELAYVAKSNVNNASCQSNPSSGCDEFTLSYKKERDGEIVTIKSRHSGRAAGLETTPEAPIRPTISVIQQNTNLVATSSDLSCEAGLTAKYSFQHKVGSGAWTAWTSWQTSKTWTRTSNSHGVSYQFQVKTRCDSATNTGDESLPSLPASITYLHVVLTPSTPNVTVSGSISSITATASTVSCQAGETRQYKIDYRVDSGAWSEGTWMTGATYTVSNPLQGSTYRFRATARCSMGSDIATSGVSSEASYTVPLVAPSGLTISAAMSGTNAVGTAAGGTCGTGATIERQIRYHSTPTSTNGSWSSYTSGATRAVGALQGHKYTFQQQARCTAGSSNSAWVTSGEATTVRPINTPSTPIVTVSTSGNTTTWSWNATSCPSGTTARYQYQSTADWGYTSAWNGPYSSYTTNSWNTTSQGYEYTRSVQTHCYTVHDTSSWSNSGIRSYLRPIATPAAPTNFSHSMAADRRTSLFTWTAPTCGPGTVGESESWFYWDGSLHDHFARGYWAAAMAPSYSSHPGGVAQPGHSLRAESRYICVNQTTGRTGSWGPRGSSPTYNT